MYNLQDRKSPLRSTALTAIFPGYYFWQENRKIEAFSLAVAVYIGYFIVLGLFIQIYLLHYTWNKSTEYNAQHGFVKLTEQERDRISLMGLVGGIFGHPFFSMFTYYWMSLLDLGQIDDGGVFIVNPFAFVFLLFILFCLRFLLYYSLKNIRSSVQLEFRPQVEIFSSNNASAIVVLPFMYVLFNPLPAGVFGPFVLFLLLPLSIIFGLRIFYNNLQDILSVSQ